MSTSGFTPWDTHPTKIIVPIETGMTWKTDGALYQEKLDGRFDIMAVSGGILAGERMPNGRFIAWDCLIYAYATEPDVRCLSASLRWDLCQDVAKIAGLPVVESSAHGGALLNAVLARGGEGVVRKLATATYFDPMEACKRASIYLCRVTSIGPGQSVGIMDAVTGLDLGRLPLRGGKCDMVRVGSIVRCEALNAFESGKLRQAVPCREWLVTY